VISSTRFFPNRPAVAWWWLLVWTAQPTRRNDGGGWLSLGGFVNPIENQAYANNPMEGAADPILPAGPAAPEVRGRGGGARRRLSAICTHIRTHGRRDCSWPSFQRKTKCTGRDEKYRPSC